jgi:hypothetical protein
VQYDQREQQAPRTLLTVRQFADKHPAFSGGALRYLIFNAKPRLTADGAMRSNGLDAALVRLGKRVLIDEAAFFRWLDKSQSRGAD